MTQLGLFAHDATAETDYPDRATWAALGEWVMGDRAECQIPARGATQSHADARPAPCPCPGRWSGPDGSWWLRWRSSPDCPEHAPRFGRWTR